MDCKPASGIDLHIHSTASDGTLSPAAIIQRAAQLNLSAIAITDHDTLTGTAAALDMERPDGLHLLSGIEISAAPPEGYGIPGSLHILGYGIDPHDRPLNDALAQLKAARENRNPRIVDALNALGIRITMAEVAAKVGGSMAGRPHIAQVLMEKGVVATMDEAFDRYLGKGKPAYRDKERIASKDAIALIRNAGGIAVLAHPGLVEVTAAARARLIAELCEMGLGGVEAYYPQHSAADTAAFEALAGTHHLLVSGGTDFHGQNSPGIEMGCGSGGFHVPYAIYEALDAALA
ncbi:MAG: PHP domain-containing protein [Desulfosarcinaceae bacterium]|nr:PHP domain-containing protein [Desulfosarcinaceae bacterium]